MDLTLPAPAESIKSALIDILRSSGYEIQEENSDAVTTGVPARDRGTVELVVELAFWCDEEPS